MNVEGADVERRLGRTVMPRFHAGFSFGAIIGAGLGVLAARFAVPVPAHLVLVGAAALVTVHDLDRRPSRPSRPSSRRRRRAPAGPPGWSRAPSPIGVMVLAFTLAEGSAGDWLALALVDGYDARHFVGVARIRPLRDGDDDRSTGRSGRARPVRPGAGAARLRGPAFTGLLLLITSGQPVVAAVGIVVWGLGAALGFPVGMSAAADDPRRARRRVSVVSTVGYGAPAGPPLLGFVGNQVGTLDSLYVVVATLVPAAMLVMAVRSPVVERRWGAT